MAHKMIVLRKKLFVILESPLTSCKNNGSKTIEQTTIRNFTKEGMYKKVSKKFLTHNKHKNYCLHLYLDSTAYTIN